MKRNYYPETPSFLTVCSFVISIVSIVVTIASSCFVIKLLVDRRRQENRIVRNPANDDYYDGELPVAEDTDGNTDCDESL